METDRKLWRADRGALFKIANTAIEEPLQRTGIRMAASVSRIFGPASEVLQGMVRGSASSTCQVPQFVDCVMKQPTNMRRAERLFYKNPCATQH